MTQGKVVSGVLAIYFVHEDADSMVINNFIKV